MVLMGQVFKRAGWYSALGKGDKESKGDFRAQWDQEQIKGMSRKVWKKAGAL